ncbi:ABC transporter substrate-binding protein [Paenibacillus hexagrammi]|uniref:Extracellular solute-binding protein n=1 Tax=Paenibacillus hexagrammi TaxID=2908839 RepID=A0ABY3SJ70_9BACL|nr:extracellular solute-binding protein [Paenibacillus sp. YPD9-1]UJF33027.1 extracellular solute-binding protein [Paenibacillus sp. YPD9-1]
MRSNWKTIGSLLSSTMLAVTLSACGSGNNGGSEGAAAVQSSAAGEASTSPVLTTTAPAATVSASPVDALYEQAKKEGKVIVYSTSGRANDAAKTFMKQYPGIQVEVSKVKSDQMMDKVAREQDAGQFNPDVLVTKEVSGAVDFEMVKQGRYLKYLPEDIAPHEDEPFRTQAESVAGYAEFRTLWYNSDHYDKPPVTNWWDLTTPEWKGKVYTADPVGDPSFMNLFSTFAVHADDMAAAYKMKFGKDIELHGTENAGYEFIKQLLDNQLVTLDGSTDVLDAIGKKDSDALAIAVTGEVADLKEEGWHAKPIYDLKPKTSVVDAGYFFLAKNAPHEAAAKLFIRWMLGEADGQGAGIEPFNEVGSWVPRDDVKTKNEIAFDQLNLWNYDGEALYKIEPKVRDFWIKNK